MPKAARIGDTNSVHECGVVPTAVGGSSNVFINGIPVHRVDDANSAHPAVPPPSCANHATVLSAGSPNVYVNGKPIGRIGDPYTCGITVTSGSPNVFVNDVYTPTDTTKPKLTKLVSDRNGVLEMIATLLFGSMAHADPLDQLSEQEFRSIFIDKDAGGYYDKDAFDADVDKILKNLPEEAKGVSQFRGQTGYLSKGNLLTHDEFIREFGGDLKEYGQLKSELDAFNSRAWQPDYDDMVNGKPTLKYSTKGFTKKEIKRFKYVMDLVEEIEDILVQNIHHQNIADLLWKHSSLTVNKPMFIERTFDKYAEWEDFKGLNKEVNKAPIEAGKTYSAYLVNYEDVHYTTKSLESGKKQYWLLPAGTKIIHTSELADKHEVLIKGDDLLNQKFLFSGSSLQAVKVAIEEKGFIDKELLSTLEEEYKARNNGQEPPKWWKDLVEDLDNIIEAAEEGNVRNWRANLLIAILTGTGSWFADSEEYWDIWNSKDMVDYQDKLTRYYGVSTAELTGWNNPNIPFHERLDGVAIATVAQGIDLFWTGVFATAGKAEKAMWKNTKEGWLYLMENLDDILEDGNKIVEDLLTPPDGWN